jgi:hypothetical protein
MTSQRMREVATWLDSVFWILPPNEHMARQSMRLLAEEMRESARAFDALPPLTMPVWKCKTCGCLWRDNLDETVSLLDAQQKSCAECERSTPKSCAIHWLSLAAEKASSSDARLTDSETGKATGSALPSFSSSRPLAAPRRKE